MYKFAIYYYIGKIKPMFSSILPRSINLNDNLSRFQTNLITFIKFDKVFKK